MIIPVPYAGGSTSPFTSKIDLIFPRKSRGVGSLLSGNNSGVTSYLMSSTFGGMPSSFDSNFG